MNPIGTSRDDTYELPWLLELRRIPKPGGLLYVTVHGGRAWRERAAKELADTHRSGHTMAEERNRGKSRGGTIIRFTRRREPDSLWEWRLPVRPAESTLAPAGGRIAPIIPSGDPMRRVVSPVSR
jgi:hypothetical protein